MSYIPDLQRSPDVVDHNGDTLPPNRKWILSGGLRAYETSEGLVLEGAVASDVIKDAVRVATTGNVADLGVAPATIDGVTMADGDRVLVKDQTSGAENGIYVWTTDGLGNEALVRATDFDASEKAKSGTIIYVREGTDNKRKLYVLDTAPPITLDATVLSFVEPAANPDFGGKDVITTGLLRYGGSNGPIVDTREGFTTLASASANNVLSWDPTFVLGDDAQLTVVAAIHARQASTDEFAWCEYKLRVAIVGGTVTQLEAAEVVGEKLTSGATSDGWVFVLEVSSGAIRVTAQNPAWASSTDNVTVKAAVEYAGSVW